MKKTMCRVIVKGKKQKHLNGLLAAGAVVALLITGCGQNAGDNNNYNNNNNAETEALKEQIARLEQQISALEQQHDAAGGSGTSGAAAGETLPAEEGSVPELTQGGDAQGQAESGTQPQSDTNTGNSQQPSDTGMADNSQHPSDNGAAASQQPSSGTNTGNGTQTQQSGTLSGNSQQPRPADTNTGNSQQPSDTGAASNNQQPSDANVANNNQQPSDASATNNNQQPSDTGAAASQQPSGTSIDSLTTRTMQELSDMVDAFVAKASAATPSGTASQNMEQFFSLKQEEKQIDDALDRHEDELEYLYRNKTLTREEYNRLERELDRLEDRLDYVEDQLEYVFGIDD